MPNFCIHCGSRLQDGSKFCANCGKKVEVAAAKDESRIVEDRAVIDEQPQQIEAPVQSAANSEITSPLLQPISSETQNMLVKTNEIVQDAFARIDEGNAQINRAQLEYNNKKQGSKKAILIIGIYLGLCALSSIMTRSLTYLLPGLVISLIASVILRNKIFFDESSEDNKLRHANIEGRSKIDEGTNILEQNANIISVLPGDYIYPRATDYIARMVSAGRVGTIAEALSMYDEQMHRWQMEDAQNAILQQQMKQNAELRRQSNTLARIEVSSAVSAMGSFMRFIDSV